MNSPKITDLMLSAGSDILSRLHTHLRSRSLPIPPGATPAELARLRRDLTFTPPPELESWLTLCRGCEVQAPSIVHLLGTRARHFDIAKALLPEWIANRWIPIADDGCGQHYVLIADRAPAPVAFFEAHAPERPEYLVASSLPVFLDLAIQEAEASPALSLDEPECVDPVWFSRDKLLIADPAAAAIMDIPFAWQRDDE